MKVTGMTWRAAVEWYGKETTDKMKATGYLNGITCTANEAGELIIPIDDLDRAYRASKGKPIFDWD
jgi:hypothetical protein